MLEEILRQLFVNAFTKLYGQEPPVQQVNFQQTRPEFEGDLTVVVFPFVKIAKKSPEVMAGSPSGSAAAHIPSGSASHFHHPR